MDSKDKKVLEKILEHSNSIIEETKNIKNAEEFKATNDKSKAALFDLMQIGELVNNSLSPECMDKIENIPWEQIYALRNRIVHGYAAVDYKIVWDTIKNDIPKLSDSISKYIAFDNLQEFRKNYSGRKDLDYKKELLEYLDERYLNIDNK